MYIVHIRPLKGRGSQGRCLQRIQKTNTKRQKIMENDFQSNSLKDKGLIFNNVVYKQKCSLR